MDTDGKVIPRSPSVTRRQVVRAAGNHLVTADGDRVLDLVSGSMTANFGYSNPDVVAAMTRTGHELPYVHDSRGSFAAQLELAQRLVEGAPLADPRAYFTVSGSDAVEAAIRLAVLHQAVHGRGERTRAIGMSGGFHGSTLGALQVTGTARVTQSYEAYLGERLLLPFPGDDAVPDQCLASLRETFARAAGKLAAVVIEPVVANGSGTLPLPAWYVSELVQLCQARDILIIADEITTSLWRCGAKFTSPLVGLRPDIVCVGKGLGVGYAAISAVLASGSVAESAVRGGKLLGHNYNSHPIAVAAALAVLDKTTDPAFERSLDALAASFDTTLRDVVAKSPTAVSYRRVGLLASIDIASARTSDTIANTLWSSGDLLVLAGRRARNGSGAAHHLTLAPSFVTSAEELDFASASLVAHLTEPEE